MVLALQTPQLWRGIAEHLAKSSPEVLVLIHPIHMTPSSHSQRALSVGHLNPLLAHKRPHCACACAAGLFRACTVWLQVHYRRHLRV